MDAARDATVPAGYTSQRVRTNGIDLHVVRSGGTGPPVVLLHGFPEFWYGWRGQLGEFAERGYDVIVPDQRGYNRSQRPPDVGAYRIDRLAGDVLGILDRFDYASAHVIGHDWGAMVAWWLGLRHAERVRRLGVLNVPHPTVFDRALRRPAQIRRSLYAAFFQVPILAETVLRAGNYRALTRSLTHTSRPETFGDLELDRYRTAWDRPGALTGMLNWYRANRRPPTPQSTTVTPSTLVMWGVRDRALLPELAAESVEYCPDGRLERFEEASHWLHHEFPERVTELLIDHLEAE